MNKLVEQAARERLYEKYGWWQGFGAVMLCIGAAAAAFWIVALFGGWLSLTLVFVGIAVMMGEY